MASRGQGAASSTRQSANRTQPRLETFLREKHPFDAGQMGIPLVCRMGYRIPHAAFLRGRFRIYEASAPSSTPRVVYASQRPGPRLRVELFRCQSAGSCVVCLARLQNRGQQGKPGPPFP